jgi:Uma2 family endonuclease
MSTLAQRRMTADEFLAWAEGQEGRWELHNGVPYRMPQEQLGHIEVKVAVYLTLLQAIRKAGVPCHAVVDGIGVRISRDLVYGPDALVYCGPKLPRSPRGSQPGHPGRGGLAVDAQIRRHREA